MEHQSFFILKLHHPQQKIEGKLLPLSVFYSKVQKRISIMNRSVGIVKNCQSSNEVIILEPKL